MPRCVFRKTFLLFLVSGSGLFLLLSLRSDQQRFVSASLKASITTVVENQRGAPTPRGSQLSQSTPNQRPLANDHSRRQSASLNGSSVSFLNSTYKCGRDGIITVKSGGRLGNLMGEYATLWALAKRDSLFPVLQQRTQVTLSKYFQSTSIPSIVNLNCAPLKWHSMNLHVYNKLSKSERLRLASEGIYIDGYPTSVSLFHRHHDDIVKEFRFKNELIEKAQRELHRFGEQRQGSATFVGVHVRRTDYRQFLEGRFHAKLVGEAYFSGAMNLFRQKYASPLFVVASDDMVELTPLPALRDSYSFFVFCFAKDWCRQHLKPVDNDVVYAGNRNIDNPAEDMALLAACNHTIISYGNFGFWSAYLGGGEVVLAGKISQTPTELMLSIHKANISHWTFFPGF